ncbi:MAG TPA: hypothetical protein DD671_06920 [Balneolaceae bacterium]|jgi:lysozyme|nr:hypothetical protein [Balneolaceae bacterium]|tara:strand:- start:8224 stop:8667 length:444 start_codon:yes stop_codon:yes gene_type:complete
MFISNEGIDLIKKFEGLELEAYQCSADVWTIGYGHTQGVEEGMKIDMEEADKLLRQDLDQFEKFVNSEVKTQLSQCQFDALVSWTFNLGVGNLRQSTMLKRLNEGDLKAVPSEMKRWNKSAGKVLDGLVRRREAEALLFQQKEWWDV